MFDAYYFTVNGIRKMIASNPTPKLARGLNKRLVRELSTAVKLRVDEAVQKTLQRNRDHKSRKG